MCRRAGGTSPSPIWKNKLTIDNLEVSGTGYNWLVAIVADQSLGWKFIEALGKNKPGSSAVMPAWPRRSPPANMPARPKMSDFHLQNILDAAASVPVRGVWPKEGVPSEPWTSAILKRAPHPNAARLFLDFLLSQEGQALYVQTMGWSSARADVAPPGFKDMPRGVEVLPSNLSPEEALKVRDDYVAKWKQLWDLGKSSFRIERRRAPGAAGAIGNELAVAHTDHSRPASTGRER